VFYGEDVDVMNGNFIDDPISTDPQGKFPFMVARKGLTCPWIFLKGFYLIDDPLKKASIGFGEKIDVRSGFLGKRDRIAHDKSYFFLTWDSETVLPFRTCAFALAIASRSSLLERMSNVSRRPSYSSLLMSTALLTPFLVMANLSNFSSASLTMAESCFLASANGITLVITLLLFILHFDHDYSLSILKRQVISVFHSCVDDIAYKGNMAPFFPLVRVGEVLHVGKGTSFGLGQYEMRLQSGYPLRSEDQLEQDTDCF